jgi:hypothetical protein
MIHYSNSSRAAASRLLRLIIFEWFQNNKINRCATDTPCNLTELKTLSTKSRRFMTTSTAAQHQTHECDRSDIANYTENRVEQKANKQR